MTKLRQRMIEELRLRNSSEETIRSYVASVERFARYYHTSPDQMNAEQVRSYLLYLLEERKLSWSAIHVNRAALRFLYVRVLRQRWFDEEIQAPKRHPQLPTVLSAEEITRILDLTRNLKHWTILATLYATGILWVSEIKNCLQTGMASLVTELRNGCHSQHPFLTGTMNTCRSANEDTDPENRECLGAEEPLRRRSARTDGAIRRPEKGPPLAPPLAAEPTVTPASPSPTKDAVWSRDSKKNTKPEFGAESLR